MPKSTSQLVGLGTIHKLFMNSSSDFNNMQVMPERSFFAVGIYSILKFESSCLHRFINMLFKKDQTFRFLLFRYSEGLK